MANFDPARFIAALNGPVGTAVAEISELIETASRDGDHAMVAQLAVEAALLQVRLGDTDRADRLMTTAMGAAKAADNDVVQKIVAWRYVAMLSMLDQIAPALRYARALQETLEPSSPVPVRIVALSVSGTLAAASGRWREVRALSEDLLCIASAIPAGEEGSQEESVRQSLVAQGHLGLAQALIRFDRTAEAAEHALTALVLARRHRFSNIGASALGVLYTAKAMPDDLDIVPWLEATFDDHAARGDLLGQINTGLMLAWFYLERGDDAKAMTLFDRVLPAAVAAKQGYAWAKALIWRAHLRSDVDAGLDELADGWAVLCEIAGAVAEPDARQALLIDWRTLAAETLAWLRDRCAQPLPPPAGQLAVRIMTALTGDGVAAALRQSAADRPAALGPGAPSGSLSIDDIGGVLAAQWNAESLAPADTVTSLAGCDVVVFRVLEARPERLAGWRVYISSAGDVTVDRFSVEGEAAFEIKRLAVGDERSPTNDRAVWRDIGEYLLPSQLLAEPGDELLLVPHGPLWLVPFAALELAGAMVIDRFTVSYLPSLAHPRARQLRAPCSAAALVDRTLPGIGLELQALSEIVTERVATTGDAVEIDTYLARSPEILFIGAHGRGRGPDFCIELPAGQIPLDRFLNWRMPEWVIASSCLSARHNAEVWPPSLVTVCRMQGASHVLGAQWEVPSRPTARIVSQVIRHVGRGDQPALALRKAQREARDKGWPLRSWAGLVNFG